jgi:hypothetical protein
MNCKPGDLAIGVRAVPEKRANLGCIVRIRRLYPGHSDSWEVETLSWSDDRGKRVPPGTIRKALDACLQPLGDMHSDVVADDQPVDEQVTTR